MKLSFLLLISSFSVPSLYYENELNKCSYNSNFNYSKSDILSTRLASSPAIKQQKHGLSPTFFNGLINGKYPFLSQTVIKYCFLSGQNCYSNVINIFPNTPILSSFIAFIFHFGNAGTKLIFIKIHINKILTYQLFLNYPNTNSANHRICFKSNLFIIN